MGTKDSPTRIAVPRPAPVSRPAPASNGLPAPRPLVALRARLPAQKPRPAAPADSDLATATLPVPRPLVALPATNPQASLPAQREAQSAYLPATTAPAVAARPRATPLPAQRTQMVLTGVAPPPVQISAEALASARAQSGAMDEIVGVLVDKTMYGSWGRGYVKLSGNNRRLTVTGEALGLLTTGQRLRMTGVRSNHPKYGDQFEVHSARPDVDSGEALVSHIQRNYRGAGSKVARALVSYHEEQGTLALLKDTLVHNPSLVDFTPVTERTVVLNRDENKSEQRIVDSLSIRFADMGVAQGTLSSLGRWLALKVRGEEQAGPEATESLDMVVQANKLLEENPYAFIYDVSGYSFRIADGIGQRLGFAMDSDERVSALVYYCLNEGCEDGGHAYLTEYQLAQRVHRMDPTLDFTQAVRTALSFGTPIEIDTNFGAPRFYTGVMRKYENSLMEAISARLSTPCKPMIDAPREEVLREIDQACRQIEARTGHKIELDESQREAVVGILTAPTSLHLLTGGPGCGKTTIDEIALTVMENMDALEEVVFCAPTGKAAKVLNARVMQWGGAYTLHSKLRYDGSKFLIGTAEPQLEVDRLDLDESSMLDNFAGQGVFNAVPQTTHIVMMGDPGQLEPIAPGSPFNALLALDDMDGVDHHHLTVTHRNSGGILALINMVSEGKWPTDPALWQAWREKDQVHFAGELPKPTEENLSQLARAIKAAAKRQGGIHHVGVLCPVRRGDVREPGWNVTYLNDFLREEINPDPEKKVRGTNLRIDDRIIITENMKADLIPSDKDSVKDYIAQREKEDDLTGAYANDDSDYDYDKGYDDEGVDDENKVRVVNGDTGWLREAVTHYEHGQQMLYRLVIQLDDGRIVGLRGKDAEKVGLAYATTVHAAQGSEYKELFAFCPPGHPSFIHRRMLLTELSRAKERLHLFGDPVTLAETARRDAPKRNCALAERVRRRVGHILVQQLNESQRENAEQAAASRENRPIAA